MRCRVLGGVAVLCLAALLARAPAQEGKDAPKKEAPPPTGFTPTRPDADYRQFFKKPETVPEFWKALQFELEVARFDLAAAHLRGLVASKPTDEALVDLAEREGMAALLKLRNIKPWVRETKLDLKDTEAEIAKLEKTKANADKLTQLREEVKKAQKEYQDAVKLNTQADNDVETLIASATAAIKTVRGNSKRINGLIGDLTASPEEAAFALKELFKTGPVAVPYLIDGLKTAVGADRLALLDALGRMGPGSVPPMVAALDSNDTQLKLDLLDVLRRRAAREVAPNLWFLSASPAQPEAVRRKASDMLAAFLEAPVSKLPSAKAALTREAERFYKHEVLFPDSQAVTIWRWDNGQVVAGWPGAATVSATKAEEYYGVRFANQALTLDPTYLPAQVVLLSLALDKGTERAGLAQPLSKGAPKEHKLLATASPDAVSAVLERALDERRTPVVLNGVRTLGGMADLRANKPSAKGEPVLVRALHYPDRRVQLAAAEALLRGTSKPEPTAAARVLDVLRRALAAELPKATTAKVLVGYFNDDIATKVASAVRAAGFEPVKVNTGREALKRLGQAADIDLLLLDAALPDPGLASLLGQLRADVYSSRLPIVLTASSTEREDALRRSLARATNVVVAPRDIVAAPKEFQNLLKGRIVDPGSAVPLVEAEVKDYAERAIRQLNRMAHGDPTGYDVRPLADAILDALRGGKLSPDGQIAAISTAGALSGARPQQEFVAVILDGNRPLPVRLAAAQELVRHIQRSTSLLTRAQGGALENLLAQQGTDAALKAELALLLGSLKPDPRVTGERLLRFQPAPPAPPATPKEKEKEKEKDTER